MGLEAVFNYLYGLLRPNWLCIGCGDVSLFGLTGEAELILLGLAVEVLFQVANPTEILKAELSVQAFSGRQVVSLNSLHCF